MFITKPRYKGMAELINAQKQLIEAQDRLINAQGKLEELYKAKIALLENENDLRSKVISGLACIAKGAEDES